MSDQNSESLSKPEEIVDISVKMAQWREMAAQGIYPSKEDLRLAFDHIRQSRFSTSTTATKKTPTKAPARSNEELLALFNKKP